MILFTKNRLTAVVMLSFCLPVFAAEDYSFDMSSYEKKAYELGGYLEFIADQQLLNSSSAAYQLNAAQLDGLERINHQAVAVELTAQYTKEDWQFFLNAHAVAEQDELVTDDSTTIFEGIISYKPDPGFTVEAGKKALKWGKGYAWNPVAFVERAKNPDEPDESREGYTMATMDLIKSYSGDLTSMAFTPVYLPVSNDVNTDYGDIGYDNLAAKLYFLYKDTDIDLLYLGEGSRSERFGFDFSRNISSNFEIHGEWAYISDVLKRIVDQVGTITTEQDAASQWLLGLRYLTENDTTIIAEYYHNGAGYSEQQMRDFFSAVQYAEATSSTSLLNQLSTLSQQTYLRRNPGRQYAYLRMTNKEPFDWLYITPALTLIANLDDGSYSSAFEVLYTGVTDIECRFILTLLNGAENTEFGEKRNEQKIEFRARYFF